MDLNVKDSAASQRNIILFMITNAQLRAARGLLGWSQARLAEGSGLGIATVKRMEGDRGPLRSSAENVLKVQQALEDAGVTPRLLSTPDSILGSPPLSQAGCTVLKLH